MPNGASANVEKPGIDDWQLLPALVEHLQLAELQAFEVIALATIGFANRH